MNKIFIKENAFNITLFVSIVFLISFSLLSYFQLIQSIDAMGLIGEASRWCERVSGGIFRETINIVWILCFFVVCLYILYQLKY